MKQEQFISEHRQQWDEFEQWLTYQQTGKLQRKRKKLEQPERDFPQSYRQICHHLALAQTRLYSPLLIERLNQMVIQGHQQLYRSRTSFSHLLAHFFLRQFPALVRQERYLVGLASTLFFGTLLLLISLIQFSPDLTYSILSGSQVASVEEMYDPVLKERFGREREADSDLLMFGHYIRNNTGIGFQTFASGLLFGIGTVFILLYNGIFIGAVAGHLTEIGYIETFWGFVSGHSAFELTAIVLSGAAGFKLSQALLFPQNKTRLRALRDNSQIAIQIMYGAATLFFMAAFVEAFWSSIAWLPATTKYAVGIGLWVLTISYFVFVGRGYIPEKQGA